MSNNPGKNTLQYLNSVLAVCLMLFFRYIPAPPPMEPLGMAILGIFIGAIYAWCTVSLIWPSILALVLLGLTDYTTVKGAFAAASGNDTVLLILFMFVFTGIIQSSGLTKWISTWIITRKIAVGRPWIMSFLLLAASFVGSAMVASVPTILICWGFLYTICQQVGYKPRDAYPMQMIVGIVFASTMGACFWPFKVGVIANFGFLASASNSPVDYSYAAFITFSAIFGLLTMIGYILMCKWIFRPDTAPLRLANMSQTRIEKLDGRQKITVALLLVLIIALMLPSFLPKGFFLQTLLADIGTTAITALVVAAALVINYGGKPLVQFKEAAAMGIAWDVLFMIAAALTLASGLTAETTGVKPFLVQVLLPVLGGKSAFIFSGLFLIMALLLTNLINNVVVSAIMVPTLYTFSLELSINAVAVLVVFIFLCNMAIMLPSSSPAGALIHGNREWITASAAIQYAVAAMLLTVVLGVCIGLPLSNLLF